MVQDLASCSNFREVRVTHSDYELDVDFKTKKIEGFAKLIGIVETSGSKHLVLDTRDLDVHNAIIFSAGNHQNAEFSIGEAHKVLGSALTVTLPSDLVKGHQVVVGIHFSTTAESSALQWLDPSQTAGGKHPYLFTQCQAIHARSFVPCQDSPGAKMTYSAVVRVPAPLTALMSAVPQDAGQQQTGFYLLKEESSDKRTYFFQQQIPIPPYLLALAVGELASRDLSPKTRVWSEPSVVDAAAHEFADTPKFLSAGESIAGEYVWGRYDLLLLPPSFPYGGMENPCLTFVTPTLLAGDRSLENVIIHEIGHSWTGNLVTNANHNHFWLNEGWTVFLERKILGRVLGESVAQFHSANGYLELIEAVKHFGAAHPYTKLVWDMEEGVDPDEAYSTVPYEKGFHFLYYLQALVGGPEVFEQFIKAYINSFKLKTLTSYDFKDFFLDYFKHSPAVSSIDWEIWFHSPGLPPVANSYDMSMTEAPYALAQRWHHADLDGVGGEGPIGASSSDIGNMTPIQIEAFLSKLLELRSSTPLHKKLTRKMAELYGLDNIKNSEIRYRWTKLCVEAEDDSILDKATSFLKSQGRMKFVRPLFRSLGASKMGKDLAVRLFQETATMYHPIARKVVGLDLGLAT